MNLKKSLAIGAVLLAVFLAPAAYPATYTVVNTNNSGAGSFRQAIEDTNANPGYDTINFNIPGAGPRTISPTHSLPALTDQVMIDGYSQPGAERATGDTPAIILIELDGSHAAALAGLYFFTNSDNSRVSGLAINRFGNGIYLLNPKGVQIDGNYIGTDTTGAVALGNSGCGIQIQQGSSDGTIVGGATPGERNVISGNAWDGVTAVLAGNCVIHGNYIGVDAGGSTPLGNGGNGVSVYGDNNTIGGATTGDRNIISGNSENGIEVGASSGNIVKGNYIGTDVSGATAMPNRGHGIDILGDNAIIGGTTAGERNVISANKRQGINIHDSRGSKIKGNYIGIDAAGTGRLANQWSGICLSESSNNTTIGGGAGGEGNVISGNGVYGVDIQGSTNVKVQGNYIGTNAGGTAAIYNGYNGVNLSRSADNNTIGGGAAGEGNVLSGNLICGVGINGVKDNTVVGNYIGTNPNGTTAIPNGGGVGLGSGASGNTIGGSTPGERNVISGNSNDGVNFDNSTDNKVEGNYIGMASDGASSLGNGGDGICLHNNSDNNTIGGTNVGAGNTIAYNGKIGVCVKSGTNNAILSNSIFSNAELGIDLGGHGVTLNDPDDPDEGPNRLQNFPEITDYTVTSGGDLEVRYRVPSIAPNSIYPLRVEFFKAEGGEGKEFLGYDTYLSPDLKTVIFTPAAPINPDDSLVSTATDNGSNSSEFSGPTVPLAEHLIHSGAGCFCSVLSEK